MGWLHWLERCSSTTRRGLSPTLRSRTACTAAGGLLVGEVAGVGKVPAVHEARPAGLRRHPGVVVALQAEHVDPREERDHRLGHVAQVGRVADVRRGLRRTLPVPGLEAVAGGALPVVLEAAGAGGDTGHDGEVFVLVEALHEPGNEEPVRFPHPPELVEVPAVAEQLRPQHDRAATQPGRKWSRSKWVTQTARTSQRSEPAWASRVAVARARSRHRSGRRRRRRRARCCCRRSPSRARRARGPGGWGSAGRRPRQQQDGANNRSAVWDIRVLEGASVSPPSGWRLIIGILGSADGSSATVPRPLPPDDARRSRGPASSPRPS